MDDFLKMLADLSSHVPEKMATLFSIEKKAEVEKYIKTITISIDELARTINSSHHIGYHHTRKHFEYIPEDLKKKADSIPALLKSNDTQQVCKILNGVFNQRRLPSAHLFEKDKLWHIFYFDQRDTADGENNHWAHGSHIHFVNYLWADLTKETIWQSLAQRKNPSFGAAHIRFTRKDNET